MHAPLCVSNVFLLPPISSILPALVSTPWKGGGSGENEPEPRAAMSDILWSTKETKYTGIHSNRLCRMGFFYSLEKADWIVSKCSHLPTICGFNIAGLENRFVCLSWNSQLCSTFNGEVLLLWTLVIFEQEWKQSVCALCALSVGAMQLNVVRRL